MAIRADAPGVSGPPVPRFEIGRRHLQLDRLVRRMPLDFHAAGGVQRHEERHRRRRPRRPGRRAAAPARGPCRPPPRAAGAALDPARLPVGRSVPERPGRRRPTAAGPTNRTPGRLQELQRAARVRPPAGRPAGRDASTPDAAGRSRSNPNCTQRQRPRLAARSGASAPATVAGPRARRRRATRSSWSPRRRGSARAAPVGVGLDRRRARRVEMLLTNSSSGTGWPEQPVDVPQVPAEQVVELQVVVRRVVVAVPPEPVAAFRDQHLLARLRRALAASTAGGVVERVRARRPAGSRRAGRPRWPIQM